jgi:alanine racemase
LERVYGRQEMNKIIIKSQNNQIRQPAWVEVDLAQLRRNFQIIFNDKPARLKVLSVVKNQGYGHGTIPVTKIALQEGVISLAVATIEEALELRQNNIVAPILIFGDRPTYQLEVCAKENITCCVNDIEVAKQLSKLAINYGKRIHVHVEIDTGMSRYGIRWTQAMPVIESIANLNGLYIEGLMSHFAMSDEKDKSYALLQIERFQSITKKLKEKSFAVKYLHMCNSGGFLDLPQAHFDMVRIGILALGVYPSQVCRRISGIEPVMSVKARISTIRDLETGDKVGYGMRYEATSKRRIGVIPLGYGDGFPRVRNEGEVLVHGKRAPIIGGNAMDATMIDITEIPETSLWHEVLVMGKQNNEEISPHDLAQLKKSVSYDILGGWSWRLPRIYRNQDEIK